MTPAAVSLLADLRAAGLQVAPSRVPGKLHVEPVSVLTPDRRQAILTHKAELLAALVLESRIRAMALRWEYPPSDLAYALEAAKGNPAGWLSCLEVDEGLEAKLQNAGMRFLP